MKKLLFLLLFPCIAHAGDLTLFQDQGGTIGTVVFRPIGQIFFDTSTTSGHPSGVGDMNWNMTIGNAQNRFLVVACATDLNDVPTSIAIAGNAMTLSASTASASGQTGTYIWTYANPPSGNQGITASFLSGIVDRGVCTSISLYGVSQSAGVDTSSAAINNPGGSLSRVTLVTDSPQEVLVDVVVEIDTSVLTPGAGQTAMSNNIFSFWAVGVSTKAASGAGSYSMSWAGPQIPMAQAAISLRPSQ